MTDPGPRWLVDLRAETDRAFVVTGASTPGWPDPHPDRDAPDDTYSRCLDPGKFRILETRVDAWAQVLLARGLVRMPDLEPAALEWVGAHRDTAGLRAVRRLDPVSPDALFMVLASTLVDGAPFGIDVGVADASGRAALLETLPDCGCDHCDSGSADLLTQLDQWVMTVARGGVVHVRRGGATATRMWEGWQCGNDGDPQWLDDIGHVPDGATVWRGQPWARE